MIAMIDQKPRQGVGIQLDMPEAAETLAHDRIGRDRRRRLAAKGRAGPGRQRTQLGQHVFQVFIIDVAGATEARHVALGEELQIIEQGGHGRIAAIGHQAQGPAAA